MDIKVQYKYCDKDLSENQPNISISRFYHETCRECTSSITAIVYLNCTQIYVAYSSPPFSVFLRHFNMTNDDFEQFKLKYNYKLKTQYYEFDVYSPVSIGFDWKTQGF